MLYCHLIQWGGPVIRGSGAEWTLNEHPATAHGQPAQPSFPTMKSRLLGPVTSPVRRVTPSSKTFRCRLRDNFRQPNIASSHPRLIYKTRILLDTNIWLSNRPPRLPASRQLRATSEPLQPNVPQQNAMASNGESRRAESPSGSPSRSASISLQAAATLNAGLQRDPSPRTSQPHRAVRHKLRLN